MSGKRAGEARRNPLLGIALLARFRAEGLAQFDDRVAGFQASLAPLIAFPLVEAMVAAVNGRPWRGLRQFLMAVVAVLALPVVSHALAVRWDRPAAWPRYATAVNWCRWVPSLIVVVLTVVGGLPGGAREAVVLAAGAYGLALHWFIAWRGLAFGRLRAALFVAIVAIGTAALTYGPRLARLALDSAQMSAG